MPHPAQSPSCRLLPTSPLGLLILLTLTYSTAIAGAAGSATAPTQLPAPATSPPPIPKLVLHVAKDGWAGDDPADVEAVLRSTAREMLVRFPGATFEPVRVSGGGGPITYFKRDADGCIRMKLDTGDSYWSQYAYQFAHELCHVLCKFREGDTGNKWLEESICETASLFAVRRMADTWATDPPYRNWKSYAPHLREYADKRIAKARLPEGKSLARWYGENEDALRKTGEDRARDTTVATALLPLFEAEPADWAAVAHLNDERPDHAETLAECLKRWHAHTPPEHRALVRMIGKEFGIELPTREGEPAGPPGDPR